MPPLSACIGLILISIGIWSRFEIQVQIDENKEK